MSVAPALAFSGSTAFSPKALQNLSAAWCKQEEDASSFLSLCCASTLAHSAVILLSTEDNSGAMNE